jgi:anion-transporting  ArsA/GET3 family ATPase
MNGSLFDRRLVLVSGKGGVGKTVVSAALALEAARRGKRVLLAQANARPRLQEFLGTPVVDHQIREVRPNLFVVNMVPREALHEYGLMVLRFERLYKIVFENRMTRNFVRAIPGLDEWSLLGKAWFHTTEREAGRWRWDVVVLDGLATGHFLAMLRMPQAILQATPEGPLAKGAAAAQALLRDSDRCGAIIVTLAEEMPVNEAAELHRALTGDIGVTVSGLAVNAVHPRLFLGERRRGFDALLAAGAAEDVVAGPAVRAARWRTSLRALNDAHLARLAEAVPGPRAVLPLLARRGFGPAEVEELRGHLITGLGL